MRRKCSFAAVVVIGCCCGDRGLIRRVLSLKSHSELSQALVHLARVIVFNCPLDLVARFTYDPTTRVSLVVLNRTFCVLVCLSISSRQLFFVLTGLGSVTTKKPHQYWCVNVYEGKLNQFNKRPSTRVQGSVQRTEKSLKTTKATRRHKGRNEGTPLSTSTPSPPPKI